MLGKYQIIERLGRGGMAEVYKAYHPQLERYAAVKVLHGFLAEGQDFQARFQREAKAIAALRHPNIVQIYDIDTYDENYFMVMEFIDGGTLKDRLLQASGPLAIREMAHIFREIASALDYAHRQGVLHRDIKPANVLLDQSGRVVLTDFGIARIVSETQFTVTGTLVGTPAYMSPEQGMGLNISTPSDIYSLGIILYEMVTGKVPFDADTPLAVIHKHINEPLPSPRTIRDDIPQVLETVIVKALAKEPGERFQSAAELVQAAEAAFADFTKVTMAETQIETPKWDAQPDPEVAPEPEQTIASRSTIAMEPEESSPPTLTSKPTVAMHQEDDIAEKATVAMEPEPEPTPQPPAVAPISKPEPVAVPKPTVAKPKVKPLPIILGIVAVAAIAGLLVWGIPKLPTGDGGESEAPIAECESIETCQALAEERWGIEDLEGVIHALETAIGFVPEDQHPPHAHLWCQRGEALAALDRIDEAIGSFEECMGWTEDNPEFEDIRVFAQTQLESLTTGASDCGAPEECHAQAEEHMNSGNFEGAITSIDTALSNVPENEHPAFAQYWCLKGEAHLALEQFEMALWSFEDCLTWTEGDPGLEELRVLAQEQIDMINNR